MLVYCEIRAPRPGGIKSAGWWLALHAVHADHRVFGCDTVGTVTVTGRMATAATVRLVLLAAPFVAAVWALSHLTR
ncbi:hypothetical protein ACFY2K_42860 [Kitasatospora sp. NPDC001309]|uniref:hypothetical protein n=1 Tax=Kitasatospora sp. NPDC001309 TaxID=3364013 RepID=UPI0036C8F389